MENSQFEIREVDPRELTAWDNNPRNHKIPMLKKSIERFGFRNIVVVNRRNNVIEAGHGRVQAAIELNLPTVPALFVDDDETTATAYTIADNRQSELSSWDEEALVPLLQEIQDMENITAIGYTDAEIKDLLRRVMPTETMIAGLSNEEKLDIYNEGTIRQIILYYAPEQYTDLLMRMRAIMAKLGVESNSELLVALIEHYEASNR